MQLREVLRRGLSTLAEHHVPSPQLAAELLLMHSLRCDRSYLYSHPEAEIPEDIMEHYDHLVAERCSGKPTQYITGHQEFWGLDLEVTPHVLIPRPETEHLVEAVLELVRSAAGQSGRQFGPGAPLRIVDVGTGSGCIAVALASEIPTAAIFAADISRAALQVARRNAERLGLGTRIQWIQSDLLGCFLKARPAGSLAAAANGRAESGGGAGWPSGPFDFVVSNPPYVGEDEISFVQREVRDFEPRLAWGGFGRGNEVYSRLIPQALALLRAGGYLAVEIGYNIGERVRALLGDGWSEVEVRPDLAGIPRVVVARKATSARGLGS